MKNIILTVFVVIHICSCSREDSHTDIDVLNLNQKFAVALAKTLDGVHIRSLIKTEALKQFDKDYDVLYAHIKDAQLGNGQTFRESLAANFKNENDLLLIERAFPLLTIYVPVLPDHAFDAGNWNVEKQIPHVAVRIEDSHDVEIFDKKALRQVIGRGFAPAFPVLVVKNSERVKFNNGHALEFVDEYFDASVRDNASVAEMNDRLTEAFRLCRNTDSWHRDYIYYNISPEAQSGEFNPEVVECLTSFSINQPSQTVMEYLKHDWTDGNLEFKLEIALGDHEGLYRKIDRYFQLRPDELFNIHFEKTGNLYQVKAIEGKNAEISLPLFQWALHRYTGEIDIRMEKVYEDSNSYLPENTVNLLFYSNFTEEGQKVTKIGGQAGGMARKTIPCRSAKIVDGSGNIPLGDLRVGFYDPIITNDQTERVKYNSGLYSLTLEPKRIKQ